MGYALEKKMREKTESFYLSNRCVADGNCFDKI